MNAAHNEQTPSVGSSLAGEAKGPFSRIFSRIFGRQTTSVVLLIFIALFLRGSLNNPQELMHDPDLWWHLANARILSTTHHFIQIEPYSFSVAGERWIDPEWISEMPFWIGYRSLGLRGIYLVSTLALCANLLFVYKRSYWKARHAGAAFWTGVLGFTLMTPNAGPRTIMIGYLALSAEMAILEAAERGKTRLLWLLPPLFLVWINLHGSWVIGLGLLTLYILCGVFSLKMGVFDQVAFSSQERKRLLLVLLASVAVLLANPYSWRMIWNPFDVMLGQKLNIANVEEWRPLDLNSPVGKMAVVAIALMILANCIHGRKWKVYELAFIFFAWFAAFDHARFTFLAAVLTIPFLTEDVVRSFCVKADEKTIPAINALLITCAVFVVVRFFPNEALLQNGLAAEYPLQSIASIQPSWRTFDSEKFGGMMDFNAKPTILDTRYDTFEHHGVLKDYLAIMNFQEPFKLLDKYQIDHVLIYENTHLSYLLEHTPGWRVEKREGAGDNSFVLFARDSNAAGNPISCIEASTSAPH